MERIFNIAGPCNPEKNYMLPAMQRLPEVTRLINDEAYFVVHAQRQCGKTTAFRTLVDEINSKGEMGAMYCSLEVMQEFPEPESCIPKIVNTIAQRACDYPQVFGPLRAAELKSEIDIADIDTAVLSLLRRLSQLASKPVALFFDEADCLSGSALVTFLRQLRKGKIEFTAGRDFPQSIALIGMRNIRDYKAKIRPDSETLGSASPFNVITEALTLRTFTQDEVKELYAQHTAETGQIFEPGVAEQAFAYSCGQPYLVNALAKWCVDKIHDRRYNEPITLDDIHEAKEKIIRERGTHLDSLMERMKEPRARKVVEQVMTGTGDSRDIDPDDLSYVLDLGILVNGPEGLKPANPMYAEIIGRYLSWTTQQDVLIKVRENPWAKGDTLDMPGLLAAFQQFWRENGDIVYAPYGYREAYPHIVLQAFLQRVINGGGEIIREMALGRGALDLGIVFHGNKYAVEIKLAANYAKNRVKSHEQLKCYLDTLGVNEGWLVVFDTLENTDWDAKISHSDIPIDGKTIHLYCC